MEKTIALNFIADIPLYDTEKPYKLFHYDILPDGQPMTNVQLEHHDNILLRDARSRLQDFTIDANAFTWINCPTQIPPDTQGDDLAIQQYSEEIISVLEQQFSPDHIVLYDYRLRLNVNMDYASIKSRSRQDAAPPVSEVHADHSPTGGLTRAQRHLTDDECKKYIDSGEYRIRCVNTWRSLLPVVEDSPLAFGDPRTFKPDELLEFDNVSQEYAGELWYPKYREHHRYYWISNQKDTELALFLSFDSSASADEVKVAPHSAFEDREARKDAPPRKSVETRAMIFNRILKE